MTKSLSDFRINCKKFHHHFLFQNFDEENGGLCWLALEHLKFIFILFFNTNNNDIRKPLSQSYIAFIEKGHILYIFMRLSPTFRNFLYVSTGFETFYLKITLGITFKW